MPRITAFPLVSVIGAWDREDRRGHQHDEFAGKLALLLPIGKGPETARRLRGLPAFSLHSDRYCVVHAREMHSVLGEHAL